MILMLCKKENITSRLTYTADFIFTSLGFNYEIISTSEKLKIDDIVLGYLQPDDLNSIKNINLINIPNFGELTNLDRLEQTKCQIEVEKEMIPILGNTINTINNDLQKSKTQKYFYKPGTKAWQIEFDLISNVFYHLSRYEERWRNFADEFENDWAKSILADYIQTPVVDRMLNFLKKLIFLKAKKNKQPLIRVLNYPKGQEFGVAFTHDVDITRGIPLKELVTQSVKKTILSISGKKEDSKEISDYIMLKNQMVWAFDEMFDFYKKRNWKATFFFLSKTFEGFRIRYNIATEKYKELFSRIKTEGYEIGLHPSLKAFDTPSKYISEKDKLEKHADVVISGMRQHYLRSKYPRLWELSDRAGLKYDSSLGYNYKAGFRSGTSFVHKTYDFNSDKTLLPVEIPLVFFEYCLPQKGMDEKKSKETIKSLIEAVKKSGGILTVLIHPSNFLQKPYCDYWEYFTGLLKCENIYNATLSGFVNWYYNRNKIKIETQIISEKKLKLKITKPKEISEFSLEIFPDGEFEIKKGIEVTQLKKNKFHFSTKLSKINIIYNYK